ncbi:phospholipase D alpha 4 [Macadamia integrifolia]|uniref:phospholipase D alpha 4 n=1 Tax=Macadamia integrifolia TaxID=60698 RepID=UPI001C4E6A6C|nr:phospholipase D alpha 4 [Macadamia integrifolia]
MERGNQKKFLHGTLEVTIFHATPYTPSFLADCLFFREKPTYVTIKIDNKKVAETSHEFDRVWNQTFQILCAHPSDSSITITMKTKCSFLGKIHIPAHQILNEASLIDGFFPLLNEKGRPNPNLKLRFILWFKQAECEPSWQRVLSHGDFQGIKNSTFPQRSSCHVTLYQDVHHHSTFHPPVYLQGHPRKLWEDVYKAIDGAKNLIYIAGWSLNPKMVLVRDSHTELVHGRGVNIGELLKRKSEEGVAVRIMLWDDETSLPIIKNKGVMNTHDEDALNYFKHTKVICRLCPRLHYKFPTLFAHHQKTITVDTPAHFIPTSVDNRSGEILTGFSNREIMSFIGGVDLCDGRYDTEEHSLFRTLNTGSHAQDFYQINVVGASLLKGGPREPWHDTHACITGEAAWDVLANFEQRWTKQCDPSLLIPTGTIPDLIHQPSLKNVDSERDWKVQVFRSIDHASATTLPNDVSVECSIHEAYVEAIRRAERFIYIENQYFIGGCHFWEKDKHCGCRNLIPVEIALKVVNKIKARERFAVYIVIPMWPEGVPESEPVQDILHWTRQTMAMMYKLIGETIQESGEPGHPRDYLNFFSLANREENRKGEFMPPYSPQPTTHYWKAQAHRRFMVYVHSKLMIVDDTYMLIGSANINQRSMDGRRDTEIAIGCYQPKCTGNKMTDGDVHIYRMSLWYEHTGCTEEVFLEPQSLDCVRRICSIGEKMWGIYSREETVDMESVHLVSYPVHVLNNGSMEDLMENGGTFPDTTSPIKGKRSKILPPIVTT